MTVNQVNHIDNIEELSFKTCAGLGCNKKPDKVLLIQIINKKGLFCRACSENLLRLDLANEIFIGRSNKK